MNKRKVTNYTEEFKKSSAQLAVESKQSVTKTAQELGVNATTLHGCRQLSKPANTWRRPRLNQ